MMATEITKIDASWAEKWKKTGVPFLSAPTVLCFMMDNVQAIHICGNYIKLSSKVMIYKFNLFMLI